MKTGVMLSDLKMNDRDGSLDMLRGICMLCVLLGHADYMPYGVMRWLTPFYVPAFFFITGYLKHDLPKYGSLKRLLKRGKRLLIPYFAYNSFLLLANSIMHHMDKDKIFLAIKGIVYSRFCLYPNVEDINNVRFFTVSNSPLWFLTALFVTEIFFEGTFYKVRNIKGVVFRSFLLLIAGTFMIRLPILLPWSIDTAMIGAVLMVTGYGWKSYEHKNIKAYIYWLFLLIYILLAVVNVNANMSVRYYGPYPLSIYLFCAGGVIGTILVKKICTINIFSLRRKANLPYYSKTNVIRKILCIIGQNSISILALHWFLFSFFDIVLEKCGLVIPYSLGYSILKIILAIALCICIEKVFMLQKNIACWLRTI